MQSDLAKRMKRYEAVSKTTLVTRMPVILRIDGKAFHTLTRGFQKPFDRVLNLSMMETMRFLCKNIQGCVLGYTQSDEITLVLVDYKKLTSNLKNKRIRNFHSNPFLLLEVPGGFEPPYTVLQTADYIM